MEYYPNAYAQLMHCVIALPSVESLCYNALRNPSQCSICEHILECSFLPSPCWGPSVKFEAGYLGACMLSLNYTLPF